MQISVIMPALNEESAIEDAVFSVLASFDKLNIVGELIIVNDGSTDKTHKIVERLIASGKENLRIINHKRPMGVGRSFLDGVKEAMAESVVYMPGDNENEPSEILRYISLLNDVDIVVPFVVNKEIRVFGRNILSIIFCSIINLTFGTSFKYTNGTNIFRRSILESMKCNSNGFFFLAEILVKAVKKGYLYADVPYFLRERKGGVSKAISFGSIKNVIEGYFTLIKDIYLANSNYKKTINNLSSDSKAYKRYQLVKR